MTGLLSLPMDSGPDDGIVGYDEFGRPVYRSLLGHRYGEGLAAQPHQPSAAQQRGQEMMQAAQAGQMWQLDTRENWGTPGQAVGALAGLLADAAWNGVASPGRAARGEPVTYGDVLDTAMDWGVMSNLGRAPAGALRSGTVASEAVETPAEHIARLLREGRANDVTDDMLAGLTPNDNMELARLYANGETGIDMQMDVQSRMARAEEMGFDTGTPLYHGTTARTDYSSINPSQRGKVGPGVYLTPEPNRANVFAGADSTSVMLREPALPNSRVMPLVATNSPADEAARLAARSVRGDYDGDNLQAYKDIFDSLGFDGVSVADERTILDPANIRSRFARFDPRLRHLANLSAGIGGAAFLPGLLAERNPE